MDCSMPGFPYHLQLQKLAQTHVCWIGDAIQPSHPLSSPSPAFNLSQHQGLFQWVKLNIQKTKIMAPGPITSWQIDGETIETVTYFINLGSKITADGDCSHEIKRRLLLGRKAMTNLDSILKSRDITLPTKICLVKAVVFPVVMHECDSWTIKKAEHWRIDAFELWCWRTLESLLDCKEIQPVHPKGNQS